MTPSDLIRALSAANAILTIDGDGHVKSHSAINPSLLSEAQNLHWVIRGAATGVASKHFWMACEQCDKVQLRSKESTGHRCIMTPRCKGKTQPLPTFKAKLIA